MKHFQRFVLGALTLALGIFLGILVTLVAMVIFLVLASSLTWWIIILLGCAAIAYAIGYAGEEKT